MVISTVKVVVFFLFFLWLINEFQNSVIKNGVVTQVEFSLKFMERVRVTCYWCKQYRIQTLR